MSRVGWSEDEDYPGQFDLWRSNVERSLAGREGQQALRDLEAAMLALPEPRLIGRRLVKGDDVCANGALVAYRRAARGQSREAVLAQMREETAFACDTCWHVKAVHGLTCAGCDDRIALFRVEGPRYPGQVEPTPCTGYVTHADEYDDDDDDGTEAIATKEGVPRLVAWAIVEQNDDLGGWRKETDEERYTRVLAWVRSRINPVAVPA